jgi:multidrug efflux system membrane fusion protein
MPTRQSMRVKLFRSHAAMPNRHAFIHCRPGGGQRFTMQRKTVLLAGAAAILIVLAVWLVSRNEGAGKHASSPAQAVQTAIAVKKDIPITAHANGYVTPINTVDVRPQVQNIVREIHVKEGQFVKAGQLLFTLDDRGDRSNVERARAEAAAGRADLADAELALKRNRELLARHFVSQSVVDTARNKVESLRQTLGANQAAVAASAVSLGYNRIAASITGRIGLISVHPGSLAQPSGEPMVTITQIDPIDVSFSLPERELANITATYPQGGAPVQAQLPGRPALSGKLVFIDNAADTQSGTIRMKARFDNDDHALWPGSYVGVSLVSRNVRNAVLVPAQAVVTGPVERFVYVVQPDQTVKMQKVEVSAIEDGQAAVTGLAAGARVVVEGTQNLRPGSRVSEAKGDAAGKQAPPGAD